MSQGDYIALAADLVEKAQKRGASLSEVYITNAKELSIEVSNQEIETLKMAEEHGLGIRVIIDQRMGFAYSSDFSSQALDEAVNMALANAQMVNQDQFNTFPSQVREYPQLDLYDPQIADTPMEDKIELAKEIERQARSYDPRVTITESCTYQESQYFVALANSLGINNTYRGAYCGAYGFLVAEENGESQTGFGLQYGLKYRDLDPAKVGREGAEKAVRMLGAKEIRTQKAAVVFDPYVATNFLGVLAPALSAEAVQKGKSLFAGKKGQKVASPLVTIIDDGAMPGGILSSPFDGEGVATQRTVLIKEGNLETFLYNTYTAAKDGVASTGNGTRGSFKSTPEVGNTNFYLEPGNISRQQLLQNITKGLYITEVMGMHTANPISGDFSVGAAGLWIENGELVGPVRGVAIAGNIMELLQAIDAVADDLTFFVGKGSPTIAVSKMTISGS